MIKKYGILIFLVGLLGLSVAVTAQDAGAGSIALVTNDGNIAVYSMADGQTTPVTTDASLAQPALFYTFPTWSSDGQLAFFGTSLIPENPYRLGVFIQTDRDTEPKGVYASQDEVFTYAHWSPGDHPDGNGRDIALLLTDEAGLVTRLLRSDGVYDMTEVSQGGPHYWDWSHDGRQMIWARFGRTLEIYDAATGDVTPLDEPLGAVASVDWSPVDDRFLAGVATPQGTDIVLFDGDNRTALARSLPSSAAYAWSHDAAHMALLDYQDGTLRVIDTQTGAAVAEPAGSNVAAFYWSPAENKLAYITLELADDNPGAKLGLAQQGGGDAFFLWHVYDLASDTNSVLDAFIPSDNMLYMLRFFDQFAHSHAVWSPDGGHIVYSTLTRTGGPTVNLIDVNSGESTVIADGNFGVFSWR